MTVNQLKKMMNALIANGGGETVVLVEIQDSEYGTEQRSIKSITWGTDVPVILHAKERQ